MKPNVLLFQPENNSIAQRLIEVEDIEFDTRYPFSDGSNSAAAPFFEYDILIFNIEEPVLVSENRRTQLDKFLESGKPVIIFLNQFNLSNFGNNYSAFNNLIPEFAFNKSDFGSKYSITEEGKKSIFFDYLNNTIIKYTISSQNSLGYISSLANNLDDCGVAFNLKDFSNCYFVPIIPERTNEFIAIVRSLAQKENTGDPPEWVNEYSFKKLNNVISNIEILQNEISDKETQIKTLNVIRKDYEQTRNSLLFGDGLMLEKIVEKVLKDFGINIQKGKIGREDLVFEYKNNNYLIEVKGSTKSASKKNISQLASHVTEYKNEIVKEVKGILLINPWRELPLEERDTKDKPNFPNEIMDLVKLNNFALLTTTQLFVAYCEYLDSTFKLNEFIASIDKANGIVKGYGNIVEYKIV